MIGENWEQPVSVQELQQRDLELKAIKETLLHDSTAPLFSYRKENNFFPVIGEGSHRARIMFIGEAPGLNEAKQGRPFCGASGKFLDVLLEHIGLSRSSVYITNIVKDRPPENRDPLPNEIDYYTPFLKQQIAIIKPEVVVTLGRISMAYMLHFIGLSSEQAPISALHGKKLVGKIQDTPITLVTLYHPAVALYNGSMRAVLLKDAETIKGLCK